MRVGSSELCVTESTSAGIFQDNDITYLNDGFPTLVVNQEHTFRMRGNFTRTEPGRNSMEAEAPSEDWRRRIVRSLTLSGTPDAYKDM